MPDIIDHKAFVARLSGDEKQVLTRKSQFRGVLHLMGHIALLAVGAAWIAWGWPLWWCVVPIHGVALVFLFTLEHECTHKTPFAYTRLNEAVGHMCGGLLFLPFTWFRYFHLAHHRWTNIPGKDPELAEPRPTTLWGIIRYTSGIPYWIGMVNIIIGNALGRPMPDYIPTSAMNRIRGEARVMIGVYSVVIAVLFWSPILLWIWIIPAVVGQPALRLYLLAEHGDCPQVTNMFENTRTTFTTAMVRFLAWNMPYHAEHHIYPAVPFHNLPALHDQVQAHLKVTSDGYVEFTKNYLNRP